MSIYDVKAGDILDGHIAVTCQECLGSGRKSVSYIITVLCEKCAGTKIYWKKIEEIETMI